MRDDHTIIAVSSGRVGNGNLFTRVMPRSYNQCMVMNNNTTTNIFTAGELGLASVFFLHLFQIRTF